MGFLELVADFIQVHQLLERGQSFVAGVSGGPDSVCLLDSLVQLGYRPVPVYVDHGLRSEGDLEGQFVTKLSESFGLEAAVRTVDVPGLLEEQGGSLEARAREARYLQLLQVAHEQNLDTIATAHHADDQIETVLMHFLRGSGLAGLRGMKPSTDLTGWFGSELGAGKRLVRPLLAVDGEEVLAYLASRDLDYRLDPSNQDLRYRRNRVRHELIPALETYNPAIRTNLLRLSKIMAEQAEWVAGLVAEVWETIVIEEKSEQVVLDPKALVRLPPALQKECMRALLARVQFAQLEPDYSGIQAAVEFCKGDISRMTLAGGVAFERVGDQVILAREGSALRLPQFPQMSSDQSRSLPLSGQVELAHGRRLTVSLAELSEGDRRQWLNNQDAFRAAFDLESLPSELELRTRSQGDRMQPLGMSGTVKLSDLFINAGIPERARTLWPIITGGEEVVWVVGVHMAEIYRLTKSTTKALVIQVEGPDVDWTRRLDSA